MRPGGGKEGQDLPGEAQEEEQCERSS